MLIVDYPTACAPEIEYVLGVILGDFLGIPFTLRGTDNPFIRISYGDREMILHAPFFEALAAGDHQVPVRPDQPLKIWDAERFRGDIILTDKNVPVLFGEPAIRVENDRIEVGIDLFGSAFFMLTRYEESIKIERDRHERFPATASLAFQESFLERPIVDEYVEILWACMKVLWPGLDRKKRSFQVCVSADVDRPYSCATKNPANQIRQIGADLILRRDPLRAGRNMLNYVRARDSGYDYRFDPFYPCFNWMMDVNEAAGNRIAFYFLADPTRNKNNGCYGLEEPAIRSLLRRIYERGHETGLHGGFNTCRNARQLKLELDHLLAALAEENIKQGNTGGRQHYLRWDTMTTPQAYEAAGLTYDSSLSYADHAGFRSGTCHEYPLFDLNERRQLKLRERPLIVMEDSVISYMKLGHTEAALDYMRGLKETCRLFDGDFTLLWHNSSFRFSKDREFYHELIV